MSNQNWKEFVERILSVPHDPAKGPDLSHIAEVHFYYGDKLKAVDVLDEDGEPCDGGLKMDEIVTMGMRSSENLPFIIVQRANGKQYNWEKKRFVLHERAPEGFVNGVAFNGGLPVIPRT